MLVDHPRIRIRKHDQHLGGIHVRESNLHILFRQIQQTAFGVSSIFTKFVAMLENKSLWFCCTKNLSDKFEGSYARPLVAEDFKYLAPECGDREKYVKFINDSSRIASAKMKPSIFVNRWHLSEHESCRNVENLSQEQ